MGRTLWFFFSLIYSEHLPQCLAHRRSSVIQCVRIENLLNSIWIRDGVTRSHVCLNCSMLFSLAQILNSFESCLIPQLSSSPPDVEAMRIYLILPEFPLLQDSKYYITLTIPLAMAILRLDTNPSKVLGEFAIFSTSGFVLFILLVWPLAIGGLRSKKLFVAILHP